jgi:hypothetical protein
LKPPGFKPLPLNINPGFKMCLSKFNLRHYNWENVDLMEGKRLRAGPGKARIEAPATPVVVNAGAKTKGGE